MERGRQQCPAGEEGWRFWQRREEDGVVEEVNKDRKNVRGENIVQGEIRRTEMPVSWGIEEDVGGQSSSAGRRASRRRTMAILFLLHPSTTKSPTGWCVCQETRGRKMPVSRGIEDFGGSRWLYSRRSHYNWARQPCMCRMPLSRSVQPDGGKGGRLMAQRKLSDLKYSSLFSIFVPPLYLVLPDK
jgi:hypothetical protein